jgi:chaperonin cofactor prefoldin
MSRRPLARSALSAALLGLALSAAPGVAQQMPASPFMQQEIPAEIEALLAEAQETQERLAGIHEQAMAGSEELRKKQDDLREMVDSAMRTVDPEFEANMDRMGELEQQAMAAQASQDGERLQALMTEAQSLAGRLQAAQAQAMDSPEVIREMEAFEEDLIAEMTRIDPETPGLLSRLEELAEELEAAGLG